MTESRFNVVYDDVADNLYVSFADAPPGFSEDTPYRGFYMNYSRRGEITGFILFDAHSRKDIADIRIFLHQQNLISPEIEDHLRS